MSRVAVIGAGYVGLTTAACLADLGNDVIVVDINREKINQLLHNHVPFFEPGLSELVERNTKAGRLNFTTSYDEAVPRAERVAATTTVAARKARAARRTSRSSRRRRARSPMRWTGRWWS